MTSLLTILCDIGLESYYNVLTWNGYESWTQVLQITEEELAALGFKLGHRRCLQRAIASSKGHPSHEPLPSTDVKT
jgi:hypothetical protein